VWAAVTQALPNLNSFIIGAADYVNAGAYREPEGLLVYPQVAGFELGQEQTDGKVTAIPVGMSAEMYLSSTSPKQHAGAILDGVDGDWGMQNRFGGGVGVEMFRTFLQGGPLSGIYCYTDEDRLRIVGGRYQFITMGSEDDDRQAGPSIYRIHRRVNYPMDAVYENVPQVLALEGPVYTGRQEFNSYREMDNLEGAPGETQRIALLHEYRGLDGTYILTSAASIVLQKRVGVRVPIEIVDPEDPPPPPDPAPTPQEIGPCGLQPPEYDGIQSPQDTGEDFATATKAFGERLLQAPSTSSPLANAMQVRGMADYILDWQARTGLDTLREQWKTGNRPKKIFGDGNQQFQLFNLSPAMWKCVPKYVELNLDPYSATKKYYLGRAAISITEDGGVVLQDAYGSQIMMSGGNIYLSANHDIIQVPGRNAVTTAGRDISVRAGRHLDLVAEEGRLTAAAARQATITGGIAGIGGVLIEGRGDLAEVVNGGENPGDTGGVTIKSNNDVSVRGSKVVIDARSPGWSARSGGGTVHLVAADAITWQSNNARSFGAMGAEFIAKVEGSEFVLGRKSIIHNLEVVGNLTYRNLLYAQSSQFAGYYTSRVLDRLRTYLTKAYAENTYGGTALKGKFLTSKQYNITSADSFVIPEPEWQLRARELLSASSSVLQTAMANTVWEGTAPMPGNESWQGNLVATVDTSSSGYKTDQGTSGEVTPGKFSAVRFQSGASLLKGI